MQSMPHTLLYRKLNFQQQRFPQGMLMQHRNSMPITPQSHKSSILSNNSELVCDNMVIPSMRKNTNAERLHGHSNRLIEDPRHRSLLDDHSNENGNGSIRTAQNLVSGAGDTVIKLNVGGSSFRLRVTSLFARNDDSRLVRFATYDHERRVTKCDAYIQGSEEYYFERSANLFDAIFKYYATGQLHRPLDICPTEFTQELAYWRIPEHALSSCCYRALNPLSASMEELALKIDETVQAADRSLRSRLHAFCEGDGTFWSTLFTFISICFVLISVIGLVLGSIHEFQVPIIKKGRSHLRVNTSHENETEELKVNDPNVIWEPHPIFGYVETVCILWFTFEYLLRITVTPNRCQFFCGLMNIVDMIAILPFYLELGLAIFGIDVASLSDIKGALLVVRVLRVLRVVRILKLGRYSSGMRTFALTLRSSARQLGMMGMVLSTGVVFFSTLLYFVEKDEKDTPFTSIPAAFWWAIVTMTTVGYGDYVPVTIPGKLIASGAIISGVLVLALPITIIVDNFMKVSGNTHNIFHPPPPPSQPPQHHTPVRTHSSTNAPVIATSLIT
ncbi:unnamed protein product, partial [Mesorhabditis belari]|uniref:BTB domain-containing protein n=1 Tax=Mesorhabditis belari TaxID=2138241 RepID=A0AAF3ETQ4_9BILA